MEPRTPSRQTPSRRALGLLHALVGVGVLHINPLQAGEGGIWWEQQTKPLSSEARRERWREIAQYPPQETGPAQPAAPPPGRVPRETDSPQRLAPPASPFAPSQGSSPPRGAPASRPFAENLLARFGLVIDPACRPGGLLIKTMNAQTICAFPKAPYRPGSYFYNGSFLVPMK
jgi:hypothetical protein